MDVMRLFAGFDSMHLSLIQAISQAVGTVLFTAIWQSALVAACLAICLRLVPRANAAHRFVIWGSGFAVALLLPFLAMFSRLLVGMGFPAASTSANVRALVHVDMRWSIAITAIWAICSLYRVVDLALHSVRLLRLWKSATPTEVHTGYSAMLEIPRRKRVELCTTRDLERPSVIGFLAPRILIPEWLFARLTPGELDQIVLHETEHLRRGDDWTNLFQKISLILFPLNPVLLWMERRLCLEREMACDEGVIRITRAPRAYAACLTSLAERGIEHRSEALSLGIWQRRPELVRRVHGILARRTALGPMGVRSLMAVLGCGLLVGSAELSRCPQLIAFTSASETNLAQEPVRGVGALPRMENAAYFPDRNPERFASSRGRSYPAPHMTQLKAIMPVRQGTPSAGAHLQHKLTLTMPKIVETRAVVSVTDPSPRVTASLNEQDSVEEQQAIADAGHEPAGEQSWIVLTTWEVVATPNTDLVSDQASDDQTLDQNSSPGPAQADPSAVQSGGDASKLNQIRGQMRVTRLVFRVLPSQNGSATEAPIRASWLVIQL